MKKTILIITLLFGLKMGVKAQNNNRQTLVTDLETGITYRPSILKQHGNSGIEFSTNQNEIVNAQVPTIIGGGNGFRIVSGPATRVAVEGVQPDTGATTIVNIRVCENTNIWPCAVIRGTKAE